MASIEQQENPQHPTRQAGTSLLRNAQAAIRIRSEKPYEFTPVKIKGESLSETIVRERRGEF